MKRKWLFIIFLFSIIPAVLLLFNYIQGEILDTTRAYVRGEGIYSKAQKEASHFLHHYIESKDEKDFSNFLKHIDIVMSYKKARQALQLPIPDYDITKKGFLKGLNHPDDIENMISFFIYFQNTEYFKEAIDLWILADEKNSRLKDLGFAIKDALDNNSDDKFKKLYEEFHILHETLHNIEYKFSEVLSEDARKIKDLLNIVGITLYLTIFTLVFFIARHILNDIKRTQQEISESEARFHSIFSNSGVGILAATLKEKKFTLANPAICKMLGYKKEQLLKMSVMDLHPKDDLEDIIKGFESQPKDGVNIVKYLPMLRSDGAKIYADISTVTMQLDGVMQNVGIFEDVTRHYESEQELNNYKNHLEQLVEQKTKELSIKNIELESYFKAMQDGVGIAEVDTKKFVNCNEAFEELTGYTKEEMENQTIDMFFAKDSIKYVINQFERNARGEIPVAKALPVLNKNGSIILCDVSARPYEVNGKLYNVGVFRDITERIQIETRLYKLNSQLEYKVNEKIKELRKKDEMMIEQSKLAQMGEMLNMIAHQWRQPLNALSASAINLSLQSDIGALTKENIDEASNFIQEQAQKMSNTINDFMEFNKPESDKEFYLIEAVERTVDIISSQLNNRSIELLVDVDKDIKVFHNKKALEHVLLNLISNARDAFDGKDIEHKLIKISGVVRDSKVELNVEDNAGGIPKDILDKVFNPYFTTKEQGKGTGIGLYMSKQMIENVKGSTITVKNSKSGALFSISFN
jgi:PAS domain S-box-containing protein